MASRRVKISTLLLVVLLFVAVAVTVSEAERQDTTGETEQFEAKAIVPGI
jgi:hypothetical protein